MSTHIFKEITAPEAAYAAGFIDGEGTINVLREGNGRFTVEITACQVDLRPLLLLRQVFGGHIYLRKPLSQERRPIYKWSVRGHPLDLALDALIPYLVNKRERALIAREMRRLIRTNTKKRVTTEETDRRNALVEAAKRDMLQRMTRDEAEQQLTDVKTLWKEEETRSAGSAMRVA